MLTAADLGMTGALSDKHFQHLSSLIETRTGIRLPPNKRSMVEGRLRKRLKALGIASVEEYGNMLFEEGTLPDELPYLIDCMTTNKTDFFREPTHFDILRAHLLPEILGGGIASPGRHIKIWSAAASIGAEAYTIAMVLDEELRNRPGVKFSDPWHRHQHRCPAAGAARDLSARDDHPRAAGNAKPLSDEGEGSGAQGSEDRARASSHRPIQAPQSGRAVLSG